MSLGDLEDVADEARTVDTTEVLYGRRIRSIVTGGSSVPYPTFLEALDVFVHEVRMADSLYGRGDRRPVNMGGSPLPHPMSLEALDVPWFQFP